MLSCVKRFSKDTRGVVTTEWVAIMAIAFLIAATIVYEVIGDDEDGIAAMVTSRETAIESGNSEIDQLVKMAEAFSGDGDDGSGSSPGNSGGAPGQGGGTPGQSGDAPGQGGDSPGKSGDAPGRGGDSPGKSGDAPGQQ